MNYRNCWILLLIFNIILLLGCHKNIEIEDISNTDSVDVQPILLDLKTRYLLINTLKTQMNVVITVKDESQEIRAHLSYKQPDKLRILALGPLNAPKAVSIANEGKFTLYFIQENEAFVAPLTDQVLSQVFDIDIRISDIRSAIFANPFLDGNTENTVSKKSGNKYIIKRTSLREDCTEEIVILIKEESPVVREWKILDSEEKLIQQIEFSDYREIGGILRPHKVVIHRIPEDVHVAFDMVKPEINVDISDEYFELDLPESTKIRHPKD